MNLEPALLSPYTVPLQMGIRVGLVTRRTRNRNQIVIRFLSFGFRVGPSHDTGNILEYSSLYKSELVWSPQACIAVFDIPLRRRKVDTYRAKRKVLKETAARGMVRDSSELRVSASCQTSGRKAATRARRQASMQ